MIRKPADPSNICIVPTRELERRIGSLSFSVVARGGTEPPFDNAYWDNHTEGIYLDVTDGTPLFASTTKYDSGSGWPSFWKPISEDRIELVEDLSHGMRRVEVRSRSSGAHLGHVFDDGPEPTGKRYCMNSAALRFVSRGELAASGLGQFESLFV